MKGGGREKKKRERQRREEGRENNPNYDVVYEESKRDERRNPREYIPTAWVKTTRCWDIIGRGISKGEGVSLFSILRGEKDRLPFSRRYARATTKISKTRSMEMDTGATLTAPLNGLANYAKPEIGSDFGGFAEDRTL